MSQSAPIPADKEKAKIPISLNNLFAASAQSPATNSTIKLPMPPQGAPVPMMQPPVPGAGKVRTLEEIENELLQSSPAKPSAQAHPAPPPGSFQPPNLQQQQMELAKLLPFLNAQQQQQLQMGNLMEQQASSLINEATIQQQQQQQAQMNPHDINLLLLQQQQQLIQRYTINQILSKFKNLTFLNSRFDYWFLFSFEFIEPARKTSDFGSDAKV